MGIGDRLKEERERLGFSQTDFAALAGASKNSQYNYEKGDRSPDAEYLAAIAAHGVDVQFVVTGERVAPALDRITATEAVMLARFRAMTDLDRATLERMSEALAAYAAEGSSSAHD